MDNNLTHYYPQSREINVGNVPIPTHYYVSIQKCSSFDTNMACFTSLDLLSFILPHIPNPHSCWVRLWELVT